MMTYIFSQTVPLKNECVILDDALMHLYCFISIVGLFRVSIVNNQCRMAAQVCEWCSPGE